MEVIIVADDMTGSNVSNSLIALYGLKVGSLIDPDQVNHYKEYDALGVNTESRGVESEVAYNRVKELTNKVKHLDPKFFSKRIDSTMRGNIGGEIKGILDALGEEYVAFVVPAYPDSEKIVIGNYMLVDGILLELTDVSEDPTSPVNTSRINSIIGEQTDYSIGTISMETVALGEEAILDTINALIANDVRIITIDATSNEQISVIANAVNNTNVPFISVDPGPFTQQIVNITKDEGSTKSKQKAVFLIGSASPIAVDQIAQFRSEFNPYVERIDVHELFEKESCQREIDRVSQAILDNLSDHQMFLIGTMINKDDKLNLNDVSEKFNISVHEASDIICESIAEIGNKIFKTANDEIGAVYTSGGDVTLAFLERTEAEGIQIVDEVEPLAVYGHVMGGLLDTKSIVTKGGLVGDRYTLSNIAEYLTTKISTKFY